MDSMGWEINEEKTIPPCQSLQFIGFIIDTVALLLKLSREKCEKGARLIAELRSAASSSSDKVAVAAVQKLVGFLNHVVYATIAGGCYMKPLFDALQPFVSRPARSLRNIKLVLSPTAWGCLDWWYDQFTRPHSPGVEIFEHENGRLDLWMHDTVAPQNPPKNVCVLTTDASSTGGGYVWGDGGDIEHRQAFVFTNAQHNCSINWKELFTGMQALREADRKGRLKNKFVLLRSDNTSAVASINKGYSASAALNPLVRDLSLIMIRNKCQVRAAHIPGSTNEMADKLSRLTQPLFSQRVLHPNILQLCQKKFGIVNVVGVRRPDAISSVSEVTAVRGKSYLWIPAPHTFTAMVQQARDWARTASQFVLLPRAVDASWWRLLQGAPHVLQLAPNTKLFRETPTYSCPQASIEPITLPSLALSPWVVVALNAGGERSDVTSRTGASRPGERKRKRTCAGRQGDRDKRADD